MDNDQVDVENVMKDLEKRLDLDSFAQVPAESSQRSTSEPSASITETSQRYTQETSAPLAEPPQEKN